MNNYKRVIFYIDGFNFYYGLKTKGWRKYYWLDCVSFFEKFLKLYKQLIELNYFSAKPKGSDKSQRQETFFSCNKVNSKFQLHLGKFLKKNVTCNSCGNVHLTFEEKETDVNIAIIMIGDVVYDKCDISILVSADSDLIPPINFIKKEFNPLHKIFVYFPPNRFSFDLRNKAFGIVKLENHENKFSSSLLPETVTLLNGVVLSKPSTWV